MELDMTVYDELKETTGSDFVDELVETYLDDAPRLLGELDAALEAQDAETFRRAAHSLKSSSATFGASRLSDLARQLEMFAKDQKLSEAASMLPAVEEAFHAVEAELKGLQQ
jgi:HPt (histidine-containing phosphotransfer) domain-containing protein